MPVQVIIDDDLAAAARRLAIARSVGVDRVIADLIRKGLEVSNPNRGGVPFPTFSVPPDARPITPEDVQRGEDEP